MLLATFLEESELDFIADNEHRTQRAREIGKIERQHLLQPRYLTKRLVVGEQARLQDLRCAHQAGIHSKIDIITSAALVNGLPVSCHGFSTGAPTRLPHSVHEPS